MDESDLRVFLSLCETENTRDTAALLRVNQSNVSRALGRLEAELGAELFNRHGRRLTRNRVGDVFRTDAARIVEQYQSGRQRVRQLTGPAGVVRLGFLQSVARRAVPQLIGAFREVMPQVRFELRQGFARELFGAIAADQLDTAFVTELVQPLRPVSWRQLAEQRLCVAVPPGHILAERRAVGWDELDGQDLVAFSRTTELRALTDSLLAEAGAAVSIAFESSEIDTIRGLVGAGLGVAVLPRPSVGEKGDPVYVPLEPAVHRRLGLAWSSERDLPAGVAAFLDHSRGVTLSI